MKKKIYILVVICLVILVGVTIATKGSEISSNTKVENPSGVSLSNEVDSSATSISSEVRFTSDEKCTDGSNYYTSKVIPTTQDPIVSVYNSLYSTHCDAVVVQEGIYSPGFTSYPAYFTNSWQSSSDDEILVAGYIYAENIDFNNVVLKADGVEYYPSSHSTISENEAYLIYEVNSGTDSVEEISVDGIKFEYYGDGSTPSYAVCDENGCAW